MVLGAAVRSLCFCCFTFSDNSCLNCCCLRSKTSALSGSTSERAGERLCHGVLEKGRMDALTGVEVKRVTKRLEAIVKMTVLRV